jgi:hypothetical protein
LVASSPLNYCHRIKEYFGHGIEPAAERLNSCVKANPHGVYIHVKPQHITFDGGHGAGGHNSSSQQNRMLKASSTSRKIQKATKKLTTPEDFFNAAKQVCDRNLLWNVCFCVWPFGRLMFCVCVCVDRPTFLPLLILGRVQVSGNIFSRQPARARGGGMTELSLSLL